MKEETRAPLLTRNSRTRSVVELITDKWTVCIIDTLQSGNKRLSELQREIDGISQKMLIQTLRHLEHDGLVSRKMYPVLPPKVEYSLTPLGETLISPLNALCRWAKDHLEEVEAARARQGEDISQEE